MNSRNKKSIWHPHLHVISKDSSGKLIAVSIFIPKKNSISVIAVIKNLKIYTYLDFIKKGGVYAKVPSCYSN